ncbi:hypothetical protein DB347_06125 [Opitutaceae bacterium EW11]|nr:hypothetical protein DB347_06125 [Opitutaceae bacterium EW11]
MPDNNPDRPLSTGEWVVTLLVLMIPLVNFVMYFVWAFADGNVNRRNFCRAQLIIMAVALGLVLVIGIAVLLFGGIAAAVAGAHH